MSCLPSPSADQCIEIYTPSDEEHISDADCYDVRVVHGSQDKSIEIYTPSDEEPISDADCYDVRVVHGSQDKSLNSSDLHAKAINLEPQALDLHKNPKPSDHLNTNSPSFDDDSKYQPSEKEAGGEPTPARLLPTPSSGSFKTFRNMPSLSSVKKNASSESQSESESESESDHESDDEGTAYKQAIEASKQDYVRVAPRKPDDVVEDYAGDDYDEEEAFMQAIELSKHDESVRSSNEKHNGIKNLQRMLKPGDLFSVKSFQALWKLVEESMDHNTLDLERSMFVREGNNAGNGQSEKHQYGRVETKATEKVFDLLGLDSSKIFLDLGSGIGNAVIQAAYTRGCVSRGIEIENGRSMIAAAFQAGVMDVVEQLEGIPRFGKIQLELGDFTLFGGDDDANRSSNDVITTQFVTDADCIFADNFNGIWGERSNCKAWERTANERVAYLFAACKPGTVLVTFDRITALGHSLDEANRIRKNRKLKETAFASFFTMREEELPPGSVSWSQTQSIPLYIYTRVGGDEAMVTCNNVNCDGLDVTEGVVAKQILEADSNDRRRRKIFNTVCIYCDQPAAMATRERKKRGSVVDGAEWGSNKRR